jgi:hypothetical protein
MSGWRQIVRGVLAAKVLAVVIVAVWLGRGVLLDWLKALHGVH